MAYSRLPLPASGQTTPRGLTPGDVSRLLTAHQGAAGGGGEESAALGEKRKQRSKHDMATVLITFAAILHVYQKASSRTRVNCQRTKVTWTLRIYFCESAEAPYYCLLCGRRLTRPLRYATKTAQEIHPEPLFFSDLAPLSDTSASTTARACE